MPMLGSTTAAPSLHAQAEETNRTHLCTASCPLEQLRAELKDLASQATTRKSQKLHELLDLAWSPLIRCKCPVAMALDSEQDFTSARGSPTPTEIEQHDLMESSSGQVTHSDTHNTEPTPVQAKFSSKAKTRLAKDGLKVGLADRVDYVRQPKVIHPTVIIADSQGSRINHFALDPDRKTSIISHSGAMLSSLHLSEDYGVHKHVTRLVLFLGGNTIRFLHVEGRPATDYIDQL